jgi:hypothetical protein
MLIGFGLPVFGLLALEWVAPPCIAAFFGFQARWSLKNAISATPLIILYSVISPTFQTNSAIPVLLPWLAGFPTNIASTLPVIGERLVWWGGIFIIALVSGHISRIVSPPSSCPHPGEEPKKKP